MLKSDYNYIGKELRKIRESKNITRKEISEELFIAEETIRRIEKGENNPRISTLIPLCDFLGLELKDFLNRKNDLDYRKILSIREDLIYYINNNNITKAENIIGHIDEDIVTSDKFLKKELFATKKYYNALIDSIKNNNINSSILDLEIALSEKVDSFKINNFKKYNYDEFSLKILLDIGLLKNKAGDLDLYKSIIYHIYNDIDYSFTEYLLYIYNIAVYYYRNRDYIKSLEICNECISNLNKINKLAYLHMIYYIRGLNYIKVGDFINSRISFDYCKMLAEINCQESFVEIISNKISEIDYKYI